jgi:hypothetical protein
MTRSSLIALIVAFALSGAAVQAEDACLDFRREIVGKKFVAKEPLYDTKVDVYGIVKLERDKEEIPKGETFEVTKVICGSGKIEVTLSQASYMKDVEIYLKYKKVNRGKDGAMENLEKMMGYICEEANEE